MVNFHFFDSAINSKTMILMNDKVPDRKLGKILNLLAAVLLLFLSFPVSFGGPVKPDFQTQNKKRPLKRAPMCQAAAATTGPL